MRCERNPSTFNQEKRGNVMKKFVTVVCLICVASLAKAALVASWNFNKSAAASGGAEVSTASLDLSASVASLSSGGGTIQNGIGSDFGGNALIISAGSTAGENGQSIVFSLSMSSLQNLVLTYATVRTSTGFNEQDWSYSTDGTTFTPFSSISGSSIPTSSSISSSSYAVETVDFTSVSALDNASSVLFELTVSGASGASGSDHFDNFQFNATAVPEPAGWGAISALGLMGICGLRE